MSISLFWDVLKRHKRRVAVFLTLALMLPPLEAFSISLVYLLLSPQQAADTFAQLSNRLVLFATPPGQQPYILFAVGTINILILAAGRFLRARLLAAIKYDVYVDYIHALFRRFMAISGLAALNVDRSEIANIAVNEIGSVANSFFTSLSLISNALSILILALVSLWYSPFLVLLAFVLGAVSVLINRRNYALLHDIGSTKIKVQQSLLEDIYHILDGYMRIKFDGLETAAIRKIDATIGRSRAWRVSKVLTREKVVVLSDSFSGFSILLILFVGIVFFHVGIPVFVALLVIFNRLRGYVGALQGEWMTLRELNPAIEKVRDTLSRLDEHASASVVTMATPPVHIELSDASFAYDGQLVIRGVSTQITAGDRILVRGPSGQGKSTLLKLLVGYYPLDAGQLVVTGEDSKVVHHFERLRPHLFYSSNELYLFGGSVREAVDYAGQATDAEIRAALRQSCLLDAVNDLPDGLDAPIGNNGDNLSLGQRQRLLLARLFLRQPRLIILDEATSNIDVETERVIFVNIQRHIDARSILVVATHRNTDAIRFNKIIEVSRGQVEAIAFAEMSQLVA